MRSCIVCNKPKPDSEFYVNKTRGNRIETRCKPCCISKNKIYKALNRQKVRAWSCAYREKRNRLGLKSVYPSSLKPRKPTPDSYKPKIYARGKLRTAMLSGIVKKLPCQICGNVNAHGHHEDYTKALEVIWLCRKHHGMIHREGWNYEKVLKTYEVKRDRRGI